MKRIALLLSFIIFLVAAHAQTYTVVKVAGTVESPALKRSLQAGDKISGKDQLKFVGKDSYIVVTSAKTGNKKIAGVPDAAPREFVQLLESFIRPDKKSTASRSIASDYVESLRMTMGSDTLLILGDGKIPVNPARLSPAAPSAIKVLYTLNKQKVQRPINTTDGFCLSQKCLFNGPIPVPTPKVGVFYFVDGSDETPEHLLGAFVPVYTNEDHLVKEIKVLIDFVHAEKKDASVLSEVSDYLISEYYKVQEDNLRQWLLQKGLNFN